MIDGTVTVMSQYQCTSFYITVNETTTQRSRGVNSTIHGYERALIFGGRGGRKESDSVVFSAAKGRATALKLIDDFEP